jgi:hypothetical protein
MAAAFDVWDFALSEREVLELQHWSTRRKVSLASFVLSTYTILLRRYQSLGGMHVQRSMRCCLVRTCGVVRQSMCAFRFANLVGVYLARFRVRVLRSRLVR